MKTNRILVVDDEKDILDLLKYNLEKVGYHVKTTADARKVVKMALDFKPDLILLDIMMPFQDGIETCRLIRNYNELKDVVVIFLTARLEEYSEVAAFDVGADDYITKPIRPRALMLRVAKSLNRKNPVHQNGERIELGELVIDRSSYIVTLNLKPLRLAKKEFELLFYLANHPNKVFNRGVLLAKVWGLDVQVLPRTVDVHIRKIREKIGDDYIKTVKGVGYKFESA